MANLSLTCENNPILMQVLALQFLILIKASCLHNDAVIFPAVQILFVTETALHCHYHYFCHTMAQAPDRELLYVLCVSTLERKLLADY